MQNLENLLERATNDEQAVREIYEFTIDRVFNYVLVRTRDREHTKEIVQEIYLSLWKSLPKFKFMGEGHFQGFLWKVVKRRLIKSRQRPIITVSLEEVYDLPADESPKEDYRHLLKSLDGLREKEKLVVKLRYFENLTFGEIAQTLCITESNAKVLHHRALATLRKNLINYV